MNLRCLLILLSCSVVSGCGGVKNISQDEFRAIRSVSIEAQESPRAYKNDRKNRIDPIVFGGGLVGALIAESSILGNAELNEQLKDKPVDISSMAARVFREEARTNQDFPWLIEDSGTKHTLRLTVEMWGIEQTSEASKLRPLVLVMAMLYDGNNIEVWRGTGLVLPKDTQTKPVEISNYSRTSLEESYESALRIVSRKIIDRAINDQKDK